MVYFIIKRHEKSYIPIVLATIVKIDKCLYSRRCVVSDYETVCGITGQMGEKAIDEMIESISADEKNSALKSSFSPTQIVQEIENISTAIELNNLLKNMNVLLENGTLNPLFENKDLVIYYKGINKKGEKYTQLRWTTKGKEFILKALNAYTTIVEPLLIIKTKIEEYKHPTYKGCYYLEVMDQYGRWWSYRGDSSSNKKSTFEDMQKIASQEIDKAIINIDLFYVHYDENIGNIKRHEEILYVYTYDMYTGEYGNPYAEKTDKYAGYVLAVTKDSLLYSHFKVFDNYQDAKQLALKIKNEGIVNLEFWTCLGNYDFESNCHEEYDYDYDMRDVYNNIATEDGEPRYLSDGVWLYPDGSTRDDKKGR